MQMIKLQELKFQSNLYSNVLKVIFLLWYKIKIIMMRFIQLKCKILLEELFNSDTMLVIYTVDTNK